MIAQLLEAKFVHQRTADLIELLDGHAAHPEKAPAGQAVPAEDLRAAADILRISLANPAFSVGDGIENTWMPCDPYLAIVQSALEECYRKAGAVASADTRGLAADELPDITEESLKPQWIPDRETRGFLREMEQSDWLGWGLSYAVATAIKTVKGRHPFRVRPDGDTPLKLSKRARLVLAADWGSGVARAKAVGRSMRKRLLEPAPAEDRHMIHLGDVYYAGRGFEYNDRFRQCWPVTDAEATTIGSWNLNANHDMFTGGHGYFGCLDADGRFARQQGFSYFALESEHWLIAGLDTAWEADGIKGDAGGLASPQLEWLMRLRNSAPGKGLILMSHHQLFSLYENDSPLLQRRIEPLLSSGGPVDAWFWGHEHRCAVYEESHGIKFPVLMGHGGVPVHASKKPQPDGVQYEYRGQRAGGLLETFAMMGFVVVDLDGPEATVRFINEENIEHKTFLLKSERKRKL